ncbi:hypothetical protein DM860_017714 [Cuscuta australis]|uniref:Uncharacterized protein n=1 Tax=Cuscuta australis TaxID=267555 RepID=A0A328D615_9ASTE|nr:hypothetical protein DM860_017714 [Cuscuta australis]
MMILFVSTGIFLFSFQAERSSALTTSAGIALRRLGSVSFEQADVESAAAAAAPSPMVGSLDPYQSDKRKVSKGSDPIHNRW